MAYISLRGKTARVYVYYVDPTTKKPKQLDRELTRQLDGCPMDHIRKWVEDWETSHGVVRRRSSRTNLSPDDLIPKLWKEYIEQQNSRRDVPRRERTVRTEEDYFYGYVIPFFVGVHEVKNPTEWHALIPAFHIHLTSESGLEARSRRQVLMALQRFGKHLVFSRHMTFPFVVQLPRSKKSKITPLKTRKTPDEILKVVGELPPHEKIDFKLAILLGYFCALGPSELYALSKKDFIAGKVAEEKTPTLKGFRKHGLGSKLSAIVHSTLPISKEAKPVGLMKNDHRYGVVNVWDPKAASLIAEILKTREDGRLFCYSYSWLVHEWRAWVWPTLNTTNHDLRRASCLYLGRTLRIDPTLLQEHMRHADFKTTQLYMRDPSVPDADELQKAIQDFDDVA